MHGGDINQKPWLGHVTLDIVNHLKSPLLIFNGPLKF
jgi:hypothetical protein